MKAVKKTIAFFLISILALSFGACNVNVSTGPDTVNITYNAGEGTGEDITETSEAGSGITLKPVGAFSKAGHVFAGWSDGTAVYAAGAPYTLGETDVTFTAQWEPEGIVIVIYKAGGGTGEDITETLDEDSATTLKPADTFLREGYIFSGWSDGTSVYNAGAQYTLGILDVTFTAQWREEPSESWSGNIVYADREVTETKVVIYDAPSIMPASEKASMTVEGRDVFLYETRVNHTREFSLAPRYSFAHVAIFDFEGTVSVTVTVNENETDVEDAVIRPLELGIVPEISGNEISFELENTGNFTLEYESSAGDPAVQDGYKNAIHIFTNTIETDAPDPENIPEDMLYVGPGVYQAGAIPVTSGQTVYLAGGAVVFGQIRAEGVDDLTIKGRGILSGSVFSRIRVDEFTLPLELRDMERLTIKDITILDPAGWAVTLLRCDGVEIDNLKIVTARPNGDGISVQSSKNVTVTGGFVRSWDDSLVVKAVEMGATENIMFDGVQVWTDLAQSCEVGYEAHGPYIKDVTFQNITILHNFHKAAISLHNADIAEISNITYRNITIEDGAMLGDRQSDGYDDYLIDFFIAYNADWSSSLDTRGNVSNILVENIKVLSLRDSIVCSIKGEKPDSAMSDVTIKNISIGGVTAQNEDDLKLTVGMYATDVIYEADGADIDGAAVFFPYQNKVPSGFEAEIREIATSGDAGVVVPDFAIIDAPEVYAGVPLDNSGIAAVATHSAGSRINAPDDDGSGPFETEGHEAGKLTDEASGTTWKSKAWTGEADEFAALTFMFDEPDADGIFKDPAGKKMLGSVRLYLPESVKYVYQYSIRVFVPRDVRLEDGSGGYGGDSNAFKSGVDTRQYTFTPAVGNYIDVKLTNSEQWLVQLRFYRLDGIFAPQTLEFERAEFLPPAVSTGKTVYANPTQFADVYNPGKLVDSDISSYYQAGTTGLSSVVIDLESVLQFKVINLHLPGILTWEPRKQEISIEIADTFDDNAPPVPGSANDHFTTLFARKEYMFDAKEGNVVPLTLEEFASARFVRITFYSNKNLIGDEYKENYGGQLSEVLIY